MRPWLALALVLPLVALAAGQTASPGAAADCGKQFDACYKTYVTAWTTCKNNLAASCGLDQNRCGQRLPSGPDTTYHCGGMNCPAAPAPCDEGVVCKNWDSLVKQSCLDPNVEYKKCSDQQKACLAAGSAAPSATTTITPAAAVSASVVEVVTQDEQLITYSTDGGRKYKPLKKGASLKKGDVVLTLAGVEGYAVLDFGFGRLTVIGYTSFTITEYLTRENLRQAQVYLRSGSVAINVPHNAAIRSDFSVTTPTSTSAIRGSGMVVTHDNATNQTTVYATEDQAYVKGASEPSETTVPQNQKTRIGTDGKTTQLQAFTTAELPAGLTTGGAATATPTTARNGTANPAAPPAGGAPLNPLLLLLLVALLGAGAYWFLLRKKTKG